MTLLALLEHLPQLDSEDRASDLLLYNHHEVSFCSLSTEASASNIQYRQPLVPSAFQEADYFSINANPVKEAGQPPSSQAHHSIFFFTKPPP
jgi:hypothetical protein